MLDEDDDMFVPPRIVPHWGAAELPESEVDLSFEREAYDSVAPPLTKQEWLSIAANNPSADVQKLIVERIAIARRMKYGDVV